MRKIEHGARRERTSEAYWKQPLVWNRKAAKDGTRPKVFPSLCDPFDLEAHEDWRWGFWQLIRDTPNLDWLLLTKRIENCDQEKCMVMHSLSGEWPLPNVWLGVSVEDQKRADERIPVLLSIPAKVRFLSVEPLLELTLLSTPKGERLDWVIVGGESGVNSRPCHIDWIRSIVQQCRLAKCPVFVKQLGSSPATDISNAVPAADIDNPTLDAADIAAWEYHRHNARIHLSHPKGGDPSEWPEDLRVREFPTL